MNRLRLDLWILVFVIQASLAAAYHGWREQRHAFSILSMVIPTACYALLLHRLRLFEHMPLLLRAFVACASGVFVSFMTGWIINAVFVWFGFVVPTH